MEDPPRPRIRRHHQAALFLLVAVIAGSAIWLRGDRSAPAGQNRAGTAPSLAGPTAAPPSTSAPAVLPSEPTPAALVPTAPYDFAHDRVQEDRGQAMGLAARVVVPVELQHY